MLEGLLSSDVGERWDIFDLLHCKFMDNETCTEAEYIEEMSKRCKSLKN